MAALAAVAGALLAASVAGVAPAVGPRPPAGPAPAVPPPAAALGRLPLAFEANTGQFDPEVRFAARTPGQQVALTADGMLVAPAGLRLQLDGARADPEIAGVGRLEASVSHFRGGDPAGWRTAVPTFGAVRYHDVYPGIDLVFHGHGRDVEHDFVVAPGADPSSIGFTVSGAAPPVIDAAGDLVVGDVRLRAPVLY
ncbi:MAG TPA: hypothetical protein VM390_07860, partial [Acidimicrobiales bacterium]|nr:hypothetical protein [Acidimicrobiales bacterium]